MKMKLWEKIFIICNIVIIFGISSFYLYRAVKYYKITNVIETKSKLIDILDKKIIYSGDGLYKDKNVYYYKGKNVDNYVLYNNILYRIIGIDDNGIKLISDNSITTLVYGLKDKYSESHIYNYLNSNYLNILNKEELVKTNWCNNSVDVNKYECQDYIEEYVGLLTSEEYLKAGGKDSYLNNNSYYWLINTALDNSKLYVNTEGGINNKFKDDKDYYSYGVRPVIVVKRDIQNYSGDGSLKNPYEISTNTEVEVNNHPIGTYVKVGNYNFRIVEKNETGVSLIYDGVLENKYNYNDGNNYINKDFISSINSDFLVKRSCYTNTYNSSNGYKITNGTVSTNYACLPNVGDLFITEYNNIWLNTKYNNNLTYTINEDTIFADLKSSSNNIRPIITIKNGLIITSGKGTKNNPLVIGEVNEINN